MCNRYRRLCVDIDNVVACTDVVMRNVIRQYMNDTVQLRYEDVTRFEYQWCRDATGRGIDDIEWNEIHNNQFSVPEVISSIEPMNGALQSLQKLADASFELHFVTSRRGEARQATEDWLKRHFGTLDYDVDFSLHRQKHKLEATFFASIEDDLEQALLFLGLARDPCVSTEWRWIDESRPFVEHSVVFAHPWNGHIEWCPPQQRHQRLERLYRRRDWPSIAQQLIQLSDN